MSKQKFRTSEEIGMIENMLKKLCLVGLTSLVLTNSAFAEEPENPWIHATRNVFEPKLEPSIGMSKKAFFKGRGMADKRELRNGEEVLWFDGEEPYYATFKNNKLNSYYTDKETIARRAEEARKYDEELKQGQEAFERSQYEAQAQEEALDQSRRQNAIRAMGDMFKPQPMPYQIPVQKSTTTNCTPGFGGSVRCTSD